MLVHRRTDGQVGYDPQGCQVEGAMMGRSVLTHQSRTVQTDDDRQLEDSHVVDDIIVGTLREGTVDIAERLQTVLGHTRRERNGVSLGDADIEGTCGHLLHHDVHRATGRHGRCHADDTLVLARQLQEGLAKDILELRRLVVLGSFEYLSCLGIELTRRMPYGLIVLCRCIAMTFLRVQVEQLRTFHVLQLPQHAHQLLHVVSVEGPEVAYVHTFEDVLLVRDSTLQGITETDESLSAVVFQQAVTLHPAGRPEAYLIIGLVGTHAEQILLHATHRAVYRHIIVIEHNEHVIGRRRHIVESFKSQSATHGTVADDGNDLPRSSLLVPRELRSHSHAQRCRDGVGGMTTDEGIVLALLG